MKTDLGSKLDLFQTVIDGKLPTLEKELKPLSLWAKGKQEQLMKTLDIVEASAGILSKEMQKYKRVKETLEALQARESQQKRTINGANTQINVLNTTLQSKDGEICALHAELEAECKNLASTNTQLEMSNIKCAGVERESNDLKTRTRMLEHEGNQPKASRAVAQGTLAAAESRAADLDNQIRILVQEKPTQQECTTSLDTQIVQLLEDLRATALKLCKSEQSHSASQGHSAD